MKRALIFVSIPTHFREMIRVARLLRASDRYSPVMFFAALYGGWEKDEAICRQSDIDVHALDLNAYSVAWIDREVKGTGGVGREQEPSPQDRAPARVQDAVQSAEVAVAPQKSLTDRLPAFIRPHFRRVWRRIYKAYLDYRAPKWARAYIVRLLLFWTHSAFLTRLFFLTLVSKTVANSDRATNIGARATILGRKLTAAFGVIWETDPKLLPFPLGMNRRLYLALPGLLKQHRIELLVLPEDNYFLYTHFFIDAAHRAGAPAVIVPFTIANSLEWVEGFFANPDSQVRWPLSILMARAFPHWTYEHKGRTLIMPALEILTEEHLGLTPPRPWLMNSGFADALAVEGPYMADYYRRAGIAPERIVSTGSLADDDLHARLSRAEEHRAALYARLDLPSGKPMLLISVPPNQLDGDGRPNCEFRTYESLVRAMLEVACGCEGWNVVLSLHPRIYLPAVKFIQQFPCKIAEDDIASLVPLCDLFVASASATIRLAAAAGKPVVNYDVFRYRYTDYENVPGVLYVEDFQSFRERVCTLTQDPVHLGTLAREQRQFAAEQALVDGHSGERLLVLFDRLTAAHAIPGIL